MAMLAEALGEEERARAWWTATAQRISVAADGDRAVPPPPRRPPRGARRGAGPALPAGPPRGRGVRARGARPLGGGGRGRPRRRGGPTLGLRRAGPRGVRRPRVRPRAGPRPDPSAPGPTATIAAPRCYKPLRVPRRIRDLSDVGQTTRRDGNGSPPQAGRRGPRGEGCAAPRRGVPGRGRQRAASLPRGCPVLLLGVREDHPPPLRPSLVASPERGVHGRGLRRGPPRGLPVGGHPRPSDPPDPHLRRERGVRPRGTPARDA